MAEVVELVAVVAFELPPFLPGPRMRAGGVDRACRVEVAVLLLGGGNRLDEAVDVLLEGRVGMHGEGVRRPLDHLVDVGVVEGIAGGSGVLERLAAQGPGGAEEVVDAARLLAHAEREGDGLGAIDLDSRGPELVGEVDGGEGHRLDRVVARRRRRRGLGWCVPAGRRDDGEDCDEGGGDGDAGGGDGHGGPLDQGNGGGGA
jgi:hypothetical protein